MLKPSIVEFGETCPTESDALPATQHSARREKRKLVRRRSGDSNESNESRRSFNSTSRRPVDYGIDNGNYSKATLVSMETLEMTPKIKGDRVLKDPLRDGYTFVRLNHSATLKKAVVDTSDFLKQQSMNRLPECSHQQNCSSRISYLEEEIKMRSQQIQLFEDERLKLKQQGKDQDIRIRELQATNNALLEELETQREQVKKLVVEKRKLESERQSLVKKIAFLEKINFSTETKNIQSFREEHLERELTQCRERLTKQKSETERMLESELARVKEELFVVRKTTESLQINNQCLQRKLDERAVLETASEQYVILRSKYRKFLVEFKDLRKEYERLQQENRQLHNQWAGKTDETLSFDLSSL